MVWFSTKAPADMFPITYYLYVPIIAIITACVLSDSKAQQDNTCFTATKNLPRTTDFLFKLYFTV